MKNKDITNKAFDIHPNNDPFMLPNSKLRQIRV